MAELHPQTFASDKILAKLVSYFNALPLDQRTVQYTDIPMFKVQLVDNGLGEDIVIGNAVTVDPSKYIGEAVYMWIGGAGPNKIATRNSFFEVSKFLNPVTPVNIRHDMSSYIGAPTWPDDRDRIYKELVTGPVRVILYTNASHENYPIDPAGGTIELTVDGYSTKSTYKLHGPTQGGIYTEFNVFDGDRVEIRYENIAVGSEINVSTDGMYTGTIIITEGPVKKSTGIIAFTADVGEQPI